MITPDSRDKAIPEILVVLAQKAVMREGEAIDFH
jgi:hypothetical protein